PPQCWRNRNRRCVRRQTDKALRYRFRRYHRKLVSGNGGNARGKRGGPCPIGRGLVPIPLPRLHYRAVHATLHAWARDHGRAVAAGGRPGERQYDSRWRLGADLMTHRVRADRWVVMGRQVIAEPFAGSREWMLANDSLNWWQPDPLAANHRTRHRLRAACGRRAFSLASKRPHLAFLLFGQPPIDAGDLLDDPVPHGML